MKLSTKVIILYYFCSLFYQYELYTINNFHPKIQILTGNEFISIVLHKPMNENNATNFYRHPIILVTSVIVIILIVGEFSYDAIGIKKIDLLSELRVEVVDEYMDSVVVVELKSPDIVQDSLGNKMEIVAAKNDSSKLVVKTSDAGTYRVITVDTTSLKSDKRLTYIEDYSAGREAFMALSKKAAICDKRTLRIAFMGDSFIEGDIFTMDVREALQKQLGGRGVGFVPITSPFAASRGSVKHTFGGWNAIAMKNSESGADVRKQTISGYVYRPKKDEEAWVKYELTHIKSRLGGVPKASFLFMSTDEMTIKAVVNDSIEVEYDTKPSNRIQQIVINEHRDISSVKLTFNGNNNFYAYGTSFDLGYGVIVDNYGDRGSSGAHFARLDSIANHDFNTLLSYDLIVLEYGLNVMSSGVMKYTAFENRMVDVVDKIQKYYPESTILIMGVGDRAYNNNGTYKTMPEVHVMLEHQRNVAKRCKVAFWNTYNAMGGSGSMVTFVNKGYAAKDYTHLSMRGAAYIADKFSKSLLYELSSYGSKDLVDEVKDTRIDTSEIYKPVMDNDVSVLQ